MIDSRVLQYPLKAAFWPAQAFTAFAAEENQSSVARLTFAAGIVVLFATKMLVWEIHNFFEVVEGLVFSLGFLARITLSNLLLAFLLMVIGNRMGFARMNLAETLALVSFAFLPDLFEIIISATGMLPANGVHVLAGLWNATIIVIGLKTLKNASLWSAIALVCAVRVLLFFVHMPFWGYQY